MYFLLGAAIGALILFIDNKFSINKRVNWGIIPFISIACGMWYSLSPTQGDYGSIIYYIVILTISFFIIRHIVKASKAGFQRYQRLQNEGSSKFSAFLKVLVGTLLASCLFVGFFIDMRVFFIAFVLAFVFKFIENTPTKRFLKFQKNLATSKIRSIAMGLVEVEGEITTGTEIKSQLGNKTCYGSFYFEYSISKDKDGKKSYTLQNSKSRMESFILTDDTGSVKVECDPDYFVYPGLQAHMDIEQGNRRYTEYLLEPKTRYLLIGTADANEKGEPAIIRKAPHMLLGVSPADYVVRWNKTGPLRRNLSITAIIALLLIGVILVTPINYRNGQLNLYFDKISLFGDN
ncbi:hypothetical protein J7315_10980 [Providencia rettgeri]|uniref:hypothetical protein n=1 Tax=Providencia rettgeri TaxID=587 RepID=UPI001B398E15|nr:hypothetical protein [Providencia rettgeri]MBQ0686588.1 hypothetical protein [Providencia rettgeri]